MPLAEALEFKVPILESECDFDPSRRCRGASEADAIDARRQEPVMDAPGGTRRKEKSSAVIHAIPVLRRS